MTSRLLAYRPEMELSEPMGSLPLHHEDAVALAAQLLEVAAPAQFDASLTGQLALALAGQQVRGTPLETPLRLLLNRVVAAMLPLHVAAAQARRQHVARLFGMELEGLNPEDKEFELARHVVYLVDAVNTALAQDASAGGTAARVPAAQVERPCSTWHAPWRLACCGRRRRRRRKSGTVAAGAGKAGISTSSMLSRRHRSSGTAVLVGCRPCCRLE